MAPSHCRCSALPGLSRCDCSPRRRKTKNSTYVVSLDPRGLVRAAPGYCGKLRSNFLGTEFTAFDMDFSKPVFPVRGRRADLSAAEFPFGHEKLWEDATAMSTNP